MKDTYAAQGPGFSSIHACLHEAIAVVRTHKAGAAYQRLWGYEGFIESRGLMDEVRCECASCHNTTRTKQHTKQRFHKEMSFDEWCGSFFYGMPMMPVHILDSYKEAYKAGYEAGLVGKQESP